MAYVRWSSEDGKSDVYCFKSIEGKYITRVAEMGRYGMPLMLSEDGKEFKDPTLQAMVSRLKWLETKGYYVPAAAYERIQQEIDDTQRGFTIRYSDGTNATFFEEDELEDDIIDKVVNYHLEVVEITDLSGKQYGVEWSIQINEL